MEPVPPIPLAPELLWLLALLPCELVLLFFSCESCFESVCEEFAAAAALFFVRPRLLLVLAYDGFLGGCGPSSCWFCWGLALAMVLGKLLCVVVVVVVVVMVETRMVIEPRNGGYERAEFEGGCGVDL